jgi:adenine-specific DNA methylase
MALKSLDVFSVHGFPVGLTPCESNIFGIEGPRGAPVGSGGWLNITEKFVKAKNYCLRPFEVRHEGKRKVEVPIEGEWIGTCKNGSNPPQRREVNLICGDSTKLDGAVVYDAIFTDPPYFGNVQYAELMDFCYVWLRQLVGKAHPEFARTTTRHPGELTGNVNMGRDLAHFTEGISATFSRSAKQLKAGAPLAFTYHHNKLDAYVPLAVGILDSGLVCSASLPCPAEMGASIHINGTKSSIIDTVFVCRSTGKVPRRWITDSLDGVASLIQDEVDALEIAGLTATQGDMRCIAHGHLTRLAIWNLRDKWDRNAPVLSRMETVRTWFESFGGIEGIVKALETRFSSASSRQEWMLGEMVREEDEIRDEISF